MLIRSKQTVLFIFLVLSIFYWKIIKLGYSSSKMASERKVHFVRHAESKFNEIHHRNLDLPAPRELSLIDAALSDNGKLQAEKAREEISKLNIDLAITSPFQRAIETCVLAHGENNVLVSPLCSERFESVCDIGTTKQELVKMFPTLDFSEVQSNIWWYVGINGIPDGTITSVEQVISLWQSDQPTTESDNLLKARADQLYKFLLARPEKNIAVFSHSHFLKKFLRWHFGRNSTFIRNAEVVSYTLPAEDN